MSKSLEIVDVVDTPSKTKLCYSLTKNKHKRVLKSRENIFKPKCSRELKKKLKKYKLRRDGFEDPDVLDVSKNLITTLRIKSPNNQDKINCNNNIVEKEELNKGNYLIRMVRKKKICTEVPPIHSFIKDSSQNVDSKMDILADEAQDKKHMNAFKLMMEARTKSIGNNSPGKEKIDEQESKEITEQKEIKAKRNLVLQKMAQSKGSQKNKEIEELRDKCIEKKMDERAARLKKMISKTKSVKNEQKVINSSIKQAKNEQKTSNTSAKQTELLNDKNYLKSKRGKGNSLQLCDIFNDTIEVIDQKKKSQKVPSEDVEFLKKLASPIKKKENMLSYFQKLPKGSSEQIESNFLVENNDSVIKIKLNSKGKKKTKKLKSSEELNTTPVMVDKNIVEIDDLNDDNKHKRTKRKRNLNIEEEVSQPLQSSDLNTSNSEGRPRRNVKKPVKYADDVQMFSSDEELHIFTPKKKKNNEKTLKSEAVGNQQIKNNMTNSVNGTNNVVSKDAKKASELSRKDENKNKLKLNKRTDSKSVNYLSSKSKLSINKKTLKLAPIFVPKPLLSPSDIEAKQKFLHSGVPEQLKKKIKKPANDITVDMFPTVVHIQQNELETNLYQQKDWFNSSCSLTLDESGLTQNENLFKNLLKLDEACNFSIPVISKLKPEKVLKDIKSAYPKFPVYRTYHLLRGKSKGEFKDCNYPELDNSIEIISGQGVDVTNENPDQLNWCDKYKPTSSKQIIGNFEIMKELKRWLETWTENLYKAKQMASDSSDFSDFYHSDTDSGEANRNTNNVLVLTGQTGSGKTSSVYAVASELAIKVIEVNASSKRTGKIMLQDLQEATQSHKVDRGKGGTDNSQKLQEEIAINTKTRGRPKKILNGKHSNGEKWVSAPKTSESQIAASQESVKTGMSLILIDDADIVFEQDDGFSSAIAQLIHCSKRPVILVTSSLTCPHLQRFMQYGKVLHMRPVLSKMLGTWLDIMCLADIGQCCAGLGAKMLDFYKGDIRKTINCLQFYMNTNKHLNKGDEVTLSQFKHNMDNENSSMSWVDSESLEAPIYINNTDTIDKQLELLNIGTHLSIFNVWWNMPKLYEDSYNIVVKDTKENSVTVNGNIKQDEKLNKIASVLNTISAIDYFGHCNPVTGTNLGSKPWYSSENASLFENENFECYSNPTFIAEEISNVLIKSTITEAQRVFKHENSLNFQTPSRTTQRYRDKIVNRHIKLSSYLHPSAVLDRRAAALDYWSTCRTICRIEKNRTDSNLKRNNRFCHYLKSLNIVAKHDFFDSLADSLT